MTMSRIAYLVLPVLALMAGCKTTTLKKPAVQPAAVVQPLPAVTTNTPAAVTQPSPKAAKRQAERSEAIVSGMSRARVLVGKGDYPGAYSVISRVLIYDVTGSDPDLEEARGLQQQINTALAEERQREEASRRAGVPSST